MKKRRVTTQQKSASRHKEGRMRNWIKKEKNTMKNKDTNRIK